MEKEKKHNGLKVADHLMSKDDVEEVLKKFEIKTLVKLGQMASGESAPDYKGQIKYMEKFLQVRKAVDDVKRSEKVIKIELSKSTQKFLEAVLGEMEDDEN